MGDVYQLRIDLEDARPPVWRRVLVPGSARFVDLHDIIQAVMPWDDAHLHEFELAQAGGRRPLRVGPADDDVAALVDEPLDEELLRLDTAGLAEGTWFRYIYDFGDHWSHKIRVEKIRPPEPDEALPRLVRGRRSAPPEDSGRMIPSPEDEEPFDDEEADRGLEPLRRLLAAADSELRPPSGLLWTSLDVDSCGGCGADLSDVEDLAWVIEFQYAEAWWPEGVEGTLCPHCGLVTAPFELAMERAADRSLPVSAVTGFRWNGNVLDASYGPRDAEAVLGSQPKRMEWEEVRSALASATAGPPPWKDLSGLPRAAKPFQMVVEPMTWVEDEAASLFRDVRLVYLILVADADGWVRAVSMSRHAPPSAEDLDGALRKAAQSDAGGKTRLERPEVVHVADPWLVEALGPRAGRAGVSVVMGPVDAAEAMRQDFADRMPALPSPATLRPWLVDEDEAAIRRFSEAATRFLDAEPWRRVPADQWFSVEAEGLGQRYVSVMGHNTGLDHHPGLVVCEDWSTAGGIMKAGSGDMQGAVLASGAWDLLSLDPPHVLHPRDADRLLRLGVIDEDDDDVFLSLRYSMEGPVGPGIGLDAAAALLEAFADPSVEVRRRARTSARRLDVRLGPVTIQGPVVGPVEEGDLRR